MNNIILKLLEFFCLPRQEHKKILNVFCPPVFSLLCIFNLTMRNYDIINQPSERGEIINFVHVQYYLSACQLSPAYTVLMNK